MKIDRSYLMLPALALGLLAAFSLWTQSMFPIGDYIGGTTSGQTARCSVKNGKLGPAVNGQSRANSGFRPCGATMPSFPPKLSFAAVTPELGVCGLRRKKIGPRDPPRINAAAWEPLAMIVMEAAFCGYNLCPAQLAHRQS